MDSLWPTPDRDVALAEAVAAEDRNGAGRPWVTMVMISSVDGAMEVGGRSGGLGGPSDLQMFRSMRGLADVIVVGGGTARSENYGPIRIGEDIAAQRLGRGQAALPRLGLVSASLGWSRDARLFEDSEFVPLIYTTASGAEGAPDWLSSRAELVVAGKTSVEPASILKDFAQRGFGTVILEGGPTLNNHFVAADLVDEVQLSLSPLVVGGGSRRIIDGDHAGVPLAFAPRRVFMEDGFLFVSYVRTRERVSPDRQV